MHLVLTPDPITSGLIATGNAVEAVLGVSLVRWWMARDEVVDVDAPVDPFGRPSDVWGFLFFVGVVGAMVSATIAVSALVVTGYVEWARLGPVWLTWWLGNVGGAFIVAPFLILWATGPRPGWPQERGVEAVASIAAVAGVTVLLFGPTPIGATHWAVEFFVLPFLLWIAYRFSRREAATAMLALAVPAIAGTLLGYGSFAAVDELDSLLLLQAFLVVIAITNLVAASAVCGLRRANHLATDRQREVEEHARALRDANEELSRSNRDLEQFARVVSHDLKGPLRTVALYAEKLERELGDRDGDRASDLLATVRGGVAHARALVDDVLEWSRVRARPVDLVPTELSTVVRDVVRLLGPAIEEQGAVVDVGALPRVMADASMLARAVQNLIENALKFSVEGTPRVEIRARRAGGEWEISIADNGVGFDPRRAELIFEPFHRLEGAPAPGTGLGLAIVRRVVERHGGRVWVESEPGVGSTFRFTLQAADEP